MIQILSVKLLFHPDNIKNNHNIAPFSNPPTVKIRAAMAGYFLRLWNVDCSRERRLRGKEYQYFLVNLSEISEIADLTLVPGYFESV